MSDFISPQLLQSSPSPPSGPHWSYEEKFDGIRGIVRVGETGAIQLFTRTGLDWTSKVPRLVKGVEALRLPPVTLDGEVVAMNQDGRSDLRRLSSQLHRGEASCFVAFDLLQSNSTSTIELPLIERRAILHQMLGKQGGSVFATTVDTNGVRLLAEVARKGGEGIVAKDINSRYLPGKRPKTWLKVKCKRRDDYVVVGWRPDAAGRLRSICLALEEDAGLQPRGWVGSGFSLQERLVLPSLFSRFEIAFAPFAKIHRAPAGARWLQPTMRAEIRVDAVTGNGMVRGAAFLGFRDDLSCGAEPR